MQWGMRLRVAATVLLVGTGVGFVGYYTHYRPEQKRAEATYYPNRTQALRMLNLATTSLHEEVDNARTNTQSYSIRKIERTLDIGIFSLECNDMYTYLRPEDASRFDDYFLGMDHAIQCLPTLVQPHQIETNIFKIENYRAKARTMQEAIQRKTK